MPEYRSQGTVRFGTEHEAAWIQFVPHGDYLVKHEDRNYAVFLPDDDDDERCIRKQCEDENGTSARIWICSSDVDYVPNFNDLQLPDILIYTTAQSAAMTQSKVQVRVNCVDDDGDVIGDPATTNQFRLAGIQNAR